MGVKINDKQWIKSYLNPYKCAVLNAFELYNVHVESVEREKYSILNSKIYYVEYNRKELCLPRV